MKNVTISLRENVERFAKTLAAEKGLSLSRFVSLLLEEMMAKKGEREQALQAFLMQAPYLQVDDKPLGREQLYDRKVLR